MEGVHAVRAGTVAGPVLVSDVDGVSAVAVRGGQK